MVRMFYVEDYLADFPLRITPNMVKAIKSPSVDIIDIDLNERIFIYRDLNSLIPIDCHVCKALLSSLSSLYGQNVIDESKNDIRIVSVLKSRSSTSVEIDRCGINETFKISKWGNQQ